MSKSAKRARSTAKALEKAWLFGGDATGNASYAPRQAIRYQTVEDFTKNVHEANFTERKATMRELGITLPVMPEEAKRKQSFALSPALAAKVNAWLAANPGKSDADAARAVPEYGALIEKAIARKKARLEYKRAVANAKRAATQSLDYVAIDYLAGEPSVMTRALDNAVAREVKVRLARENRELAKAEAIREKEAIAKVITPIASDMSDAA